MLLILLLYSKQVLYHYCFPCVLSAVLHVSTVTVKSRQHKLNFCLQFTLH